MTFIPLERSRLVGALGVQLLDAVVGRAADVRATVTAIRSSDGFRTVGVAHGGGVAGFLTLPAANYQLLVEPGDPRFLPTRRSTTVAATPTPHLLQIPLLPSPAYAPGARAVVVRGSIRWSTPAHAPARWAIVWGSLDTNPPAPAPPVNVSTMWTRADHRGEFQLVLPTAERDSDGNRPWCDVTVEIHSDNETTPTPPDDSLDDLPLDDADIATLRASIPLRRTLSVDDVADSTTYSLNTDSYVDGSVTNLVVLVS